MIKSMWLTNVHFYLILSWCIRTSGTCYFRVIGFKMSSYGSSSNDSDILNEQSLPVDLQSKNVISSPFSISPIPSSNGLIKSLQPKNYTNGVSQPEPFVFITEQPQQRGFRFRYECEGPSHGGLQGTKSERSRKSYPAIKIENYTGAARVVVSLVTDEKTPRPHAHKLVGTNCKDGLCTVELKANPEYINFPNLCILHVTRKKLIDVLTERNVDTIKLNKKLKANNMNFEPQITDDDERTAKQQAEEQSKNMQLNVVKLCFQVFLRNPDGTFSKMLTPVVSQAIYDSKSPGASALKICRMDKYGGCCSGNEEVFLLCEKVQKDDIQVRFVEQNGDGSVKWEAYGNFGPLDVHRQYAIVFKTPAYWNTNIDKPVNVLIMLQRKSDQEVSEPKAFTYFPQNRDKDNIASKKRKRIPLDGYEFGGEGGLGGTDMGGDGGGMGHSGGNGGMVQGLMGGNIGNSANIMMLQNDVILQIPIPTLVEEAVREDYENRNRVLDSHRLRATIKNGSSPMSSCSDPWMMTEDLDIEVDAAIMPTTPRFEDDSSHTQQKSSKSFPDLKSAPTKLPGKAGGLQETKLPSQMKTVQQVSVEWLDSGVSVEEKKLSVTSKDEMKDVEVCKTSSSDDHSDSEAKVEFGGSEGVKSDEGFSETSEEAGIRGQQHFNTTLKSHTTQKVANSTELYSANCSKITETVRKVTGRVAERTVAALTDFAETGDIRHLLLVQRHLLAVSNKNGDLPLHLAVINSQSQALKSLLDVMSTLPDAKRHINSLNLLRQTPLHLATVMHQDDMVEMLLHAGADPTVADRHGNTCAHLAVLNKSESCLKTLVKYLRPCQSKLDPFPELNYLNFDGYSPVHLASQMGCVELLKVLVFAQAQVDLPDGKSGKTALHHSVDNDDLPVASYLLLEAHADVNARCFDGNTALHIACARQLVGMVALLMTAGADMNCENEEIPDTDTGGEEGGIVDRRGLKPIDYADDNELILRILYGEPQIENTVGDNSDYLATQLSWMSLNLSSNLHQSLILASDTSHSLDSVDIDSKVRVQLSRLLDPPLLDKDVVALAKKLGFSNIIVRLESMRSSADSPTTFLLDYFEAVDGDLKKLKDSLLAIDRASFSSSLPLAPLTNSTLHSFVGAMTNSAMHSFVGAMTNSTMHSFVGAMTNSTMHSFVGAMTNSKMHSFVGAMTNSKMHSFVGAIVTNVNKYS
ncbi:Nuclear factor NF-kappa-B p105 subunit [Bulinus truncatus]|nr:Nuclear factor NF-kappa-B p105 subunit [Bulinus truncatus]